MLAFAALCPLRGAWTLRSIQVLVLRKYSKVCELNSRDSGWVSQIAIDFDNLNIAHAKPRVREEEEENARPNANWLNSKISRKSASSEFARYSRFSPGYKPSKTLNHLK